MKPRTVGVLSFASLALALAGCGEMSVKEIHASLRDSGFSVPPPAAEIDAQVAIDVRGTVPDAGPNYAQALAQVLSEDLAKAFTQPAETRAGNEAFVLRVSFVLDVASLRGGSFEVQGSLLDVAAGSLFPLRRRVSNRTGLGSAVGWPQYREVVPGVYRDLKDVFDLVDSRNAMVKEVLAKGSAAERRREPASALSLYTGALQQYGADDIGRFFAVIDRAIDVALKMRPRPAVPADAARHADAALAQIKAASTRDDLSAARIEYLNALTIAPWWADAWFNLAALNEQTGATLAAARDLKFYLRAAPNARDREAIAEKIARLETSNPAEPEERLAAALVGRWSMTGKCNWGQSSNEVNIVSVRNGQVTITGGPWNGSFKGGRLEGRTITLSWGNMLNTVRYTGTIVSESSMRGTFTQTVMGGTCSWSATKL